MDYKNEITISGMTAYCQNAKTQSGKDLFTCTLSCYNGKTADGKFKNFYLGVKAFAKIDLPSKEVVTLSGYLREESFKTKKGEPKTKFVLWLDDKTIEEYQDVDDNHNLWESDLYNGCDEVPF